MMLKVKSLSVLGISLFICMSALAQSLVNETGKVLIVDMFGQSENLMTGQSLDESSHYILLPGKKVIMEEKRSKSLACNGDEQIKTTYRISISGAPVESTPMLSGTYVESCASFKGDDWVDDPNDNVSSLRIHPKEQKLEFCSQDGNCWLRLSQENGVTDVTYSAWENGMNSEVVRTRISDKD